MDVGRLNDIQSFLGNLLFWTSFGDIWPHLQTAADLRITISKGIQRPGGAIMAHAAMHCSLNTIAIEGRPAAWHWRMYIKLHMYIWLLVLALVHL